MKVRYFKEKGLEALPTCPGNAAAVRFWERGPTLMEMFPMFLRLDRRPCLVVGAGTIAGPKIESLLRAGGAVSVVAPRASESVIDHDVAGRIAWHRREFNDQDVSGYFLVIAATDVWAVNHRVAQASRSAGILCNSVDDPPDCDFFYPSVVRRGDLQVAISTAGKSPALSQQLRREIDAMLAQDAGEWLDQIGETRLRVLKAYPAGEERKAALHQLAQREICDPQACPVQQSLDRLLAKDSLG